MVRPDDAAHITAIYGEVVEGFSEEAEILAPHGSIDHATDLEPGYNVPYG
jgi:hypothetical protein